IESARGQSGCRQRRIAARQTTHAAGSGSARQRLREGPCGETQLKAASLTYARALADIALAQGAGDPALHQLIDFREAYAESAELRNFLASPAVDREAKHAVIDKLVARLGVSKIVRNFLFVVSDHGRMNILPEIVESFQEVVRERQGISEAEI